eukprot:6391429-Alexandrium_andersonii.AAC.1
MGTQIEEWSRHSCWRHAWMSTSRRGLRRPSPRDWARRLSETCPERRCTQCRLGIPGGRGRGQALCRRY